MKIAVDTCIGHHGISILRLAGHEVVVVAGSGEPDRDWFARALNAQAEIVIAADTDIEILCYDANITFFKAFQHHSGVTTAHRLLDKLWRAGNLGTLVE